MSHALDETLQLAPIDAELAQLDGTNKFDGCSTSGRKDTGHDRHVSIDCLVLLGILTSMRLGCYKAFCHHSKRLRCWL